MGEPAESNDTGIAGMRKLVDSKWTQAVVGDAKTLSDNNSPCLHDHSAYRSGDKLS